MKSIQQNVIYSLCHLIVTLEVMALSMGSFQGISVIGLAIL